MEARLGLPVTPSQPAIGAGLSAKTRNTPLGLGASVRRLPPCVAGRRVCRHCVHRINLASEQWGGREEEAFSVKYSSGNSLPAFQGC